MLAASGALLFELAFFLADLREPFGVCLIVRRAGHRLLPEARNKEYGRPPRVLQRSPGHHKEWINACKGGEPAGINFDKAGPLTEVVLLGNVALRFNKKLTWDPITMTFPNAPEADEYIHKQYRRGWEMEI